jgi:hypothetical protein
METYIHIGYPKNASTALQTDFFPKLEGSLYLGCRYGEESSFVSHDIQEALTSIAMSDSINFSYTDTKMKIKSGILKAKEDGVNKIIISWEAFTNNVADRGLVAERLNKIFPDAKILIIIRNQNDSLRSMYSFLVQQLGKNINLSYGRPSVETFEKWILEQEAFPFRSYFSTLKYYELIKEYWRLFGKQQVAILLFEELANSPNSFFEKILSFLNIKSVAPQVSKRNESPTKNQIIYYKFKARFPNFQFSRFSPKFLVNFGKRLLLSSSGVRAEEELPLEIQERLMGLYKDGNRKLQEELKIDLAKFGYVV